VLVTADADLLVEAAARQRTEMRVAGVIHMHQLELAIGRCVDDLEPVAHAGNPQELTNQEFYLPL
jgi:hypothetical protein